MSDKEQPKNKPDDEQSSEQSEETPKDELSPGDSEDRCLLSSPPPAGAEALPVASGSGASKSRGSKKIAGMMKRCNPFKPKNPKKRRLSHSFSKARDVFKRTFRKSDTYIETLKPESEKKHPRKISDPTHYKTKVEPQTESEPETKKSFFHSLSASTSKETKTKTEDDQKSKESKSKRFFSHFSGSTSKEASVKPESKKEETQAGSDVQKKPLSPRASNQPSIGNVSVSFFNEGMLPSESSGVPTESTSIDTQDVKSGSSFSPDSSSKKSSTKRPRAKDNDNESSFSD